MANNITLVKDFDISKLSYNDVRNLDTGGKVVYVSYNKAPLVLQTPMMYAPFGLQKWTNDGKDKYTLNLSFRGMDNSKSMSTFHQMLKDFDTKFVNDGFANQGTWFKGKKLNSIEVVDALYTPLITPAKDKNTGEVTDKYPSTFKVTVPMKDGKFACEVYDENQNPADLLTMNTKGARVSALIQFAGLWFAGGKFGSSWRVVQLLVKPNQTIRGFAFQKDDEDALANDKVEETNEVVHDDPKDVIDMAVTHTDDEGDTHLESDDSDDDLERTTTQKKTTTKKVTMRKK
jgi:hypothetical protein